MRDRGPSRTAQWVGFARAALSTRAGGRVLDDRHAGRMLPARLQPAWAALHTPLAPVVFAWLRRRAPLSYLAARTRWLDDVVRTELADGARQLIVVGAGYDTRALRLTGPGVRCVEVDHPATQRDKRARMARRGWGASTTWAACDSSAVTRWRQRCVGPASTQPRAP